MSTELLLTDRTEYSDSSYELPRRRKSIPSLHVDHKLEKRKTWRQKIFTRRNIILFLVSIFVLLLGVMSALLSYFLSAQNEIKNGKESLKQRATNLNII